MLAEPKYDRFWNDSLTPSENPTMSSKVAAASPLPSPPPPATSLAHPCPPPLAEEQEVVTTFCMLIPKMPQWKFSSPAGFLSRSPSSASKDLSASAKPGNPGEAGGNPASSASGLAAVLSACEPVCATPCSLQVMNRLRGGTGSGRKTSRAEGGKLAGEEWSRKGSFISKPVQGWLHPDERVLGPGVSYIVRVSDIFLFAFFFVKWWRFQFGLLDKIGPVSWEQLVTLLFGISWACSSTFELSLLTWRTEISEDFLCIGQSEAYKFVFTVCGIKHTLSVLRGCL